MSAPVRLVGFVAILAVVFAAAVGLGAAVGPTPSDDAPRPPAGAPADHGEGHDE